MHLGPGSITRFAHARASLDDLTRLFRQLAPPDSTMRQGFYRASFVGPWWLRTSAAPSIYLGGLPGWQGKRFLTPDTATNVLRSGSTTVDKLTMSIVPITSTLDGKPGIALSYGPKGPRPWRWVLDELRTYDENTILGMTVVDLPLLRSLAFPFLLERER